MKDNDLGRRASAEPALVADATGAASVSAHSGDGQAQGHWQDHLSPFCQHMLEGGAADLAKDIARVAAHQTYLMLREHMKNGRADALAQSAQPGIRDAVWELITKGYVGD